MKRRRQPAQGVARRNPSKPASRQAGKQAGTPAHTNHRSAPRARVVGMATAGVAPRIMATGPAPATLKMLAPTGLGLAHIDVIEPIYGRV